MFADKAPRCDEKIIHVNSVSVSDRKQVKPFDYVPNVKDDVTKFVRHSSNLLEQLQQQLKPFAEAEFKEKLVENNTSHTVVIVKPELKASDLR